MTCGVCGAPLPDGAQFCPNCGTPTRTTLGTDERKMVTVLFADLVDSTGLGQRLDAERARDVLGRFYDAAIEELQALRGQPEKFIGDAVMAVFGLPQVHEDDAVRAVRAGLAIRGRVRRVSDDLALDAPLEIRVGIEAGEAATGVGPAGQLLVTGPVVNAAARLQAAADPGEVLAGDTARALTEAAVSFGESRRIDAKGFATALAAHPVEGLTTRSARRTIPFVGRAGEIAILRQSFSRVGTSGRPLLFTVLGEPGIGKSRLADEFVASVDPDVAVLVGRRHASADSATFAPAAIMVRDAAGIDDADPPEKVTRRLRELIERVCHADEHERTIEQLSHMLGLKEAEDQSLFVHDVWGGFMSFVEGVAAERPTVLLFEDVHELRAPMIDLIERLTMRPGRESLRVLVLVTARPQLLEERPGWGTTSVNHVMVRLEPLSAEDSIELARQAGSGRLGEDETATIAARAGGNPFFIVESTGMLLRNEDGTPVHGTASLPPTVQAMVTARLDHLEPEHREVARRLSAFLYTFDLDEARLVAHVGEDELQALVDAEIIVAEEPRGPSRRWRFRHEMLRDVTYASVPKRLRRELHLAIAAHEQQTGHPTWAADHLEAAAIAGIDVDPGDRALRERAADALAAAGDRARRRMLSKPAVDYYRRALEIAGPETSWGIREARVLAGMGEARYWLAEYPAARASLERAVELGGTFADDLALSIALRFLGDIAINVEADVDKAEGLLARSLEAAERLGDPVAIARTLLFAGWVPWTRQRYQDAEPIWQRALDVARASGDRWSEIRALTSLSINLDNRNEPERAMALIDEAQALAQKTGDRFSVAMTSTQRGRLEAELGRYQDAVAHFEGAIAVFSDLGARWELADATAERGISLRELGQLDAAEDDLRQAIRISEELGERQLASWTWRALARVSQVRGDPAEAEERFRRAEHEEARGPR